MDWVRWTLVLTAMLTTLIALVTLVVIVVGPDVVREKVKVLWQGTTRFARKAASYFRIYNRRALIRHLLGGYIGSANMECRVALHANGKIYRSLYDVERDSEADVLQALAVEQFRSFHQGQSASYSKLLYHFGEKAPRLAVEAEDKVRCKIYRNNKDYVIVLTDDDIRAMFPQLTRIDELDMKYHGLEEYVSGSLADRHW